MVGNTTEQAGVLAARLVTRFGGSGKVGKAVLRLVTGRSIRLWLGGNDMLLMRLGVKPLAIFIVVILLLQIMLLMAADD